MWVTTSFPPADPTRDARRARGPRSDRTTVDTVAFDPARAPLDRAVHFELSSLPPETLLLGAGSFGGGHLSGGRVGGFGFLVCFLSASAFLVALLVLGLP